jgi:hypothetical protein
MRTRLRQERLLPGLLCSLLLLSLCAANIQDSSACSWDYLIWMNRSKSADPLYRFVQHGKAGYIDRAGIIVIPPQFNAYDNIGDEFHDGLLQVGIAEGDYVDISGKKVIEGLYRGTTFSEGLAVAMKKDGDQWGYIDRTGAFVIGPRFGFFGQGYAHPFSEGLAAIETPQKTGYINHSGEYVIQPSFLYGSDFHEGRAAVVVEGPCMNFSMSSHCPGSGWVVPRDGPADAPRCKFTFIDQSGALITDERYDAVKEFSEGLAPVVKNRKWGYIDKAGRMVIAPQFDGAEPFSDGMALIRQGLLSGYIDYSGKIVIPAQYHYAESFSEGLAVVATWNEKTMLEEEFYYINKQGRQALAERFERASHFLKGLAHVRLKSDNNESNAGDGQASFAYIDASGKRVFAYRGEH